jgi:uncharacterized membrane protein YidH (DUF202 family)
VSEVPQTDDLGVSNERTALAWQRTALAVLAAAVLVTRLTVGELGGLAFVCTAVAVPVTLWLFTEGRLRYLHQRGSRLRAAGRGGRATAAVAVATVAVAITELAALGRS